MADRLQQTAREAERDLNDLRADAERISEMIKAFENKTKEIEKIQGALGTARCAAPNRKALKCAVPDIGLGHQHHARDCSRVFMRCFV
jgi:hypothetical protein